MNPQDDGSRLPAAAPKREYVPPKLERLGTIRELTHGTGKVANFDATHPPGQNKSALA